MSLLPKRTEMEGFIAQHAESKEEWVVQRFGNKLIRRVIKTTASAEVYQRTIKTYGSGNKALEAFHAEKRRAAYMTWVKSKGLYQEIFAKLIER